MQGRIMNSATIRAFPLLLFLIGGTLKAQDLSRDQYGAPLISVKRSGTEWTITGKNNKVILNEADLRMRVEAGKVHWMMAPSSDSDMVVKSRGKEFFVRLADAGKKEFNRYDTGFKTGVKIRLEQFKPGRLSAKGSPPDLALIFTVCLEGKDEELVCDVTAIENETKVRRLDWPKELDARDVDHTILSNARGNLLPRNWPEAYHPINKGGKDRSFVESNLIECWSMSWWGFQKGNAALAVIVETPDDAAYVFDHPPGGPTVIGPRWRASLGALRYARSVRMCFIPQGNYVAMAKQYRKHVMDKGLFVSLKEKIAREPLVAGLIGTPHIRLHTKRNYKQDSFRYDPDTLENNYHVTTFDERIKQLQDFKNKGLDRMFVTLAGWPYLGYDRQHPDGLPPAPDAGGWEGLRRFVKACKDLGYLLNLHDQYRDYYTDAPSWDPQFAAHEEDSVSLPTAFPGTRFGSWKEGYLPFMNYWDGGKMSYLSTRFVLGHVIKNYRLMFEQGIKTQGSYLDVFGYIPPTEDFNPEHPVTRTDCMMYQAECFTWVRNNLGLVGTEDGADWVIPYVDYATEARAGACVSVPLYMLVYHDAVMTPEGENRDPLRTILNGAYPTVPRNVENKTEMDFMRAISALHKRVALLEMTNHEFLDKNYRKERTTFSDGTTVTIDRDAGTYEVRPELRVSR